MSCGNVVFGGIRTLLATEVGIVSATRYQFSIAAASDVDGGNFNNQLTFVPEPADDLKSFKGTYSYRGRSGTFEMPKTQ